MFIIKHVNERTNDSIDEKAECDDEILRPTKPPLKSAIQLIQSHFLQTDSGDKHLPKLDDIERFIDQSFCTRQTLTTDFISLTLMQFTLLLVSMTL